MIFARANHEVTFSFSRNEKKLAKLAHHAGANGHAGSPLEAVSEADLVLLAVHWLQIDDVLEKAGGLVGKTVMTRCNPLNASNTELVIGHTASGAEVPANSLPDSCVVAAFQTVPSEVLLPVFEVRNKPPRPSLMFGGDDPDSKALSSSLIDGIGFAPVDAGSLRLARYLEPFGMLTDALAYGTGQGPQWAYRVGRFDKL